MSIKEARTRHGIPKALVDWTHSMLTGRKLTVNLNEKSVRGRSTGSCPQGGVLSPLLWCLVVNDLLTELKEADFQVYGYADDIAIVVRGALLVTLRERMVDALRIVQNWCGSSGLMGNPSKTTDMIFAKKYKPELIEPLRIWGREITYASSVKYLGVILDRKLSWVPHLEEKRKKGNQIDPGMDSWTPGHTKKR